MGNFEGMSYAFCLVRSHVYCGRVPVAAPSNAWVCFLRLPFRSPPGAWVSVFCEYCVPSGSGICIGLITRPEESYRVWCVCVCVCVCVFVCQCLWSWSPIKGGMTRNRVGAPQGKKKYTETKWEHKAIDNKRRLFFINFFILLFQCQMIFVFRIPYCSLEDFLRYSNAWGIGLFTKRLFSNANKLFY